jgi:hypothetical protein
VLTAIRKQLLAALQSEHDMLQSSSTTDWDLIYLFHQEDKGMDRLYTATLLASGSYGTVYKGEVPGTGIQVGLGLGVASQLQTICTWW